MEKVKIVGMDRDELRKRQEAVINVIEDLTPHDQLGTLMGVVALIVAYHAKDLTMNEIEKQFSGLDTK